MEDKLQKFLKDYAPAHMTQGPSAFYEIFRLVDLLIDQKLMEQQQSILIQGKTNGK